MPPRTKIICTIGPAVNSYEMILELIDAGMNVARLNFSHGLHTDHKKTIDTLKRARKERGVPLAIMLDNKGPEIRVGILEKPLMVEKGDRIRLTKEGKSSDRDLPISPGIALDPLEEGNVILFDDGYIGSHVVEVGSDHVIIELLNGGEIKSQKGVNMPGVNIPLPALTEQDIEDIKFGCKNDVDLIAASFIRSAQHVREIKALLLEQGKGEILLISKIENALGVENFESILQVSDGIMVARGDLGVELPIEKVPVLQKMMIRTCIQAAKPVVTATQMLESMIENPRPTRAEASDVANAIYDSTSAVMLSGETAVGKYPIETVKLMGNIVESAEADFDFHKFFFLQSQSDSHDISSCIALACVKTAYSTGARAIFSFTNTGSTARNISRYRPQMPIIALTPQEKTYHQLAFYWGVVPAIPAAAKVTSEAFAITSRFAREKGLLQFGDLVVVTAGTPFGLSGSTNMMIVESIGEVLIRGDVSEGETLSGVVQIVLTPDEYAARASLGKIVVIAKCDKSYISVLKKAKAIILQNFPEDADSESFAKEMAKRFGVPLLVRADGAMVRVQDGQTVTLDPKKGTVYKKMSSLEEEFLGISD